MDLQNEVLVPQDAVCVEGSCGVKPQCNSLFPVAHTFGKDVGLESIGLTSSVSQELEVQLTMVCVSGRKL